MKKKRILALALCAALLTPLCAASADAGGQDDPLVSRSYIEDTFLPQARAAASAAARAAVAGRNGDAAAAFRIAELASGDGLRLSAGQQLVIASGELKIYTESGETVNVSAGAVAENGVLGAGTRLIVCEDAALCADAVGAAAVKVSTSAAALSDGCPFRDVSRSSWYHGDVAAACRRGLVNGMDPTRYEPRGSLTVAQCVKLAACMHQLWHTGAVTLENSPEGPWYGSYAAYAREAGILDEDYADYGAAIGRAEFVRLFYRALPAEAYAARNEIPDGAIPDVGLEDEAAAEIYAFYRAGILTGYTATPGYAEHAFGPDSTITRSEMAAIMNRMFDETARISFTI